MRGYASGPEATPGDNTRALGHCIISQLRKLFLPKSTASSSGFIDFPSRVRNWNKDCTWKGMVATGVDALAFSSLVLSLSISNHIAN